MAGVAEEGGRLDEDVDPLAARDLARRHDPQRPPAIERRARRGAVADDPVWDDLDVAPKRHAGRLDLPDQLPADDDVVPANLPREFVRQGRDYPVRRAAERTGDVIAELPDPGDLEI